MKSIALIDSEFSKEQKLLIAPELRVAPLFCCHAEKELYICRRKCGE